MPRDIFMDVTRPPAKLGSQAWYTVPASIFTHAAIVAILVIIPLVSTDIVDLPTPDLIVVASAPPPPLPPEPVAPPPVSQTPNVTAPSNPVVAPTTAPENIADEVPVPQLPPGVRFGEGPLSQSTGTPGAITSAVSLPDPPPPAMTKPVRVGTGVMYPKKIRDVRPTYPRIAIDARVQGIVTIEAIIGVDGHVKDAKVLRSIPLLDRAALEAVNQWRFSPTQLNGVPVPVIITITVDFKLN